MSKNAQIIKELRELGDEGMEILKEKKYEQGRHLLMIAYEPWYTRALAAIRQIVPERLDDFVACYKQEKRKTLDVNSYTISDYLQGITVTRLSQEVFNSQSVYYSRMITQVSILTAASKAADSILNDIKTVLQAELLDSDLATARELKKSKHLRSAGVICGVILEAHLKSVAARKSLTINKKNATISDLNDLLRNANVYDVSLWRLLQRLADIRNYCCHRKERDPREDEVEDLLVGTDKILKEVV